MLELALTPPEFDALSTFLTRAAVAPAEQVAMQALQGKLRSALAQWQEQQQAAQAQAPPEPPAE
jgi:hypothetical protein